MKLKRSTLNDIEKIMQIINDAKIHLASLKIDQWQNGYPNRKEIEKDILKNESYVVLNNEKKIIATSMFTLRPEPTYKIIEGNWIIKESEKYGVIHRLAIEKKYKNSGIATFILKQFHQELKNKNIKSLKIDTHEDNFEMQSLIEKLGYQYCGIIFTKYHGKRLAFEKVID
ncbi:MAG: Uncharacterised protein [Flavobacterium sp. SCGC AAA160-P02]|nr:MAG: Uncharacterised protein [Flavobacterium sp. SCGC AAA160-P02]